MSILKFFKKKKQAYSYTCYNYSLCQPFHPDTNPFCVYSFEDLGDNSYRMCGIHPTLKVGDIVEYNEQCNHYLNMPYKVVEFTERRAPAGALRNDERFKEAYFIAILKRI